MKSKTKPMKYDILDKTESVARRLYAMRGELENIRAEGRLILGRNAVQLTHAIEAMRLAGMALIEIESCLIPLRKKAKA